MAKLARRYGVSEQTLARGGTTSSRAAKPLSKAKLAARPIPRAWRGLWFGEPGEGEGVFDVRDPLTVMKPIFRLPDGDETVSLVDRVLSSSRQ